MCLRRPVRQIVVIGIEMRGKTSVSTGQRLLSRGLHEDLRKPLANPSLRSGPGLPVKRMLERRLTARQKRKKW
jgi:hypothetical protein